MEKNLEKEVIVLPSISLETPLEDFKKLLKSNVEELNDLEAIQNNYDKITAEFHEVIWELLFKNQTPSQENLYKAGNCLKQYKLDAHLHPKVIWTMQFCYQCPSTYGQYKRDCLNENNKDVCLHCAHEYNGWITNVCNELKRRKMFDFWQEYIVAEKLGPCWARETDFYTYNE